MSTDQLKDAVMCRFVVTSEGVDENEKVHTRLFRLDSAGDVTADMVTFLKSKSTKGLAVGHVYDIPVRDDKFFIFGHKKWVGALPDPIALKWQAEQKAFDLHNAVKAREKKEATDDSELAKKLEPIRRAYQSLPPPGRLSFELWVLSVLRRKS